MNLDAIQSSLRSAGHDGWLFYDHHHRDPIGERILGLDPRAHITRRWYYYIPAEGEPLKLTELPLNLPAGWDFAKVFGEQPRLPAPPTERRADAGDTRAQAASIKRPLAAVALMPDTVRLPQTATDAELKMIAGSILLGLGLILLGFNRRRTFAR